MIGDYTYVIGLMSGTSLDGVDLVYVRFEKDNYTNFKILASETIPYTLEWKKELQEAIFYSKEKLAYINVTYGALLADVLNTFIESNKILKIDFIASHGHTILHQPEKGYTLQVGDGQTIANKTKQKVVCDFRTQDIQLGGQGAPLVPIGDKLLFTTYDYCVNLGGFANVSYEKENHRLAFDICPVNIVLNFYTRKLNLDYDDGGQLARSGKLNNKLLEGLNKIPFYSKSPPKSLGLEWVQETIFPLINALEKDISSILKTFVEHAAIQMAANIEIPSKVLFTGGGVFNSYLIERIEFYTKQRVVVVEKELIEYKEALIFAFLGILRVHNKVNCLASVTGATKDHSSGEIFTPNLKEC